MNLQVLRFGQVFANLRTFIVSSRSSPPEVYLGKSVLKTACNFTGEQSCRSTMHFGMDVLLKICFIFSEHFFRQTYLEGCFCSFFCGSKKPDDSDEFYVNFYMKMLC